MRLLVATVTGDPRMRPGQWIAGIPPVVEGNTRPAQRRMAARTGIGKPAGVYIILCMATDTGCCRALVCRRGVTPLA